jgi:two-component system OmpR family response regulator
MGRTYNAAVREDLITIVEDDAELREMIRRGLEREGFRARAFKTAAELLLAVKEERPAAAVIDIGLPDADGRDLCQSLRAAGVDAPVIFVTAKADLSDRLSGFHAGGDDYLTKPFAFEELVLRIRALLRRTGDPGLNFGGLHLDPTEHAVHANGSSVVLTPTEFRIFGALAGRGSNVVRRSDLTAAAWPPGAIVHDNTLDSYIARIRRKLREEGIEAPIVTVHGVGYRIA